jgi:hypothetical protein
MPLKKPMNVYTSGMAANKALQTDKARRSCLSYSQKLHQPVFAAELGR